jgi:hypothetical protein
MWKTANSPVENNLFLWISASILWKKRRIKRRIDQYGRVHHMPSMCTCKRQNKKSTLANETLATEMARGLDLRNALTDKGKQLIDLHYGEILTPNS